MAPKTVPPKTTSKPLPAINKTLSYVIACIKFHATLLEFDPLSLQHTAFAQFAFQKYVETFPTPSQELLNVLKFGSGSGSLDAINNAPTVESKLAKVKEFLLLRTNGRAYRIVLALSSHPRLKAYALAIDQSHLFKFPILSTICRFFTDVPPFITTPRANSSLPNIFETAPASAFQRLLFLASLPLLRSDTIDPNMIGTIDPNTSEERSRPAKKRQRVSKPNTGTSAKASAQQRLGWAIQVVVNAWNEFLSTKGLPDAEVLFLPYLSFSKPSIQDAFALPISVLATRDEGFAPDIAGLPPSTLFEAKGQPQPPSSYAILVRDTEGLDDICRELAVLFIQDIHSSISAYDVYSNPPTTTPSSLLRFSQTSGETHPLKARFTNLGRDIISRLETTLPSTGNPPTPQQPIPSRPPLNTAPPTAALTATEWETSMQTVAEAMLPHARLYMSSFHGLLEEDDRASPAVTSIKESVQLVLTDPPYNVTNRDYDQISRAEMTKAVDTIALLLRKGGHGIIFCTMQQFRPWEKALEKCKLAGSNVFNIDKVPMVFAKHPGYSSAFPGRSSCTLQNCAEFAIHFKKNGLPYAEEKDMVSYRSHNFVPSNNYPGYKNIIDNVWGLLPGEQIREDASRSPVRTAQKPVSLLKELISRFSKPGDLVVDLFAGTFSTAVACFELPDPRIFVGCEKDSACFAIAEDTVIRRFAAILSSPNSPLSVSDEAKAAASALSLSKPLDNGSNSPWMPPAHLPPLQSFPPHIISALSSYWEDPEAYPNLINKPVNTWPQKYQAIFTSTIFHSLRTTEAVISGLIVAPSRIQHVDAGVGVFAARDFGRGETVCHFYGSLVYSDLSSRTAKYKTYGTGPMGVTPGRFRSTGQPFPASHLAITATNSPTKVYVVPPPFVVAGYVNNPRYRAGDREYADYTNGSLLHPRRANVSLVPSRKIIGASQLVDYDLLVLRSLTDIHFGDELYLDYD